MIFETLTLSFILAKLKGGKIKNLEQLYIKGWYLILLSFITEAFSLLIVIKTNNNISRLVIDRYFIIQIFIYILLIIGLVLNYQDTGFRITTIGAILNFIALLFNNGKMPVSLNALKIANLYNQIEILSSGRILTRILMNTNTNVNFLGDIIPIPFPLPKVISFGDILIALGLFLVIQKYMNNKFKGDII